MKPKLIVTVGLPRSGKSTWSKEQAGKGIPVVSPDEIRKSLGIYPFVAARDHEAWDIARVMVESLFSAGSDTVILDATNVTRRRRNSWKDDRWDVQFALFLAPEEVCIDRARRNGQEYLQPVIERMSKSWEYLDREELDRVIYLKHI